MESTDLILVLDMEVKLEGLNRLERLPQMLVEHNIYQRFGDTKLYYRVDKANNAPGQQRHIHVFKDDEGRMQVFAINFDGTKHDGSKYQLSLKAQAALTSLGIPVPPNGLLECEYERDEGNERKLLLD